MPAPPDERKRCHNPECTFLVHVNPAKMGSFCCKKCHQHFSQAGNVESKKPLSHGDLCGKTVAPEGREVAAFAAPDAPMPQAGSAKGNRQAKKRKKYEPETQQLLHPVDAKPSGIWMEGGGRMECGGETRQSLSQSPSRKAHETSENWGSQRDGRLPRPASGAKSRSAGAENSVREGASTMQSARTSVDALQSPSHQDSLANQIKDLFTYPKGRAQSDEESCSSSGSSPSVRLHAVDDERPASRSSTESESDSDECHRAAGAAAVSSRNLETAPRKIKVESERDAEERSKSQRTSLLAEAYSS
ncbi:unnamed protein product [Symbiodinium pilosum]|uniref:Uncharacterized protein n=1 Tax=Symbiodinium pilosum TaxID=2952 RepID=A0A812UH22_SYMPI|nr:unnamed protein product [Symbiodinium pilosum]